MLYLDYAKQMNNGYILNFFADNENDILEVADGKEFITKNGTNYGVPLASSTVVITMPDKSEKTYVLNDEGVWEIGGEKSGTEVEVNVETTDQDEDLKSLKVGDTTYNNIKMTPVFGTVLPSFEALKGVEYKKKIYRVPVGMIPAFGTVLPSNEALKGVEYNEKIYRIPVGMIPAQSTAVVTGGNITKMEYNGEIYSTGVSINSDSYDYMKKDVLNYIVNNDTVYSLPEYEGLVPYSGTENPTKELSVVQDSSTGTIYSVGGGTKLLLIECTYTSEGEVPNITHRITIPFDSQADYEAVCQKYIAGEINIRLVAKSATYDNAERFIVDIVGIDDMTFTNSGTSKYLFYVHPSNLVTSATIKS